MFNRYKKDERLPTCVLLQSVNRQTGIAILEFFGPGACRAAIFLIDAIIMEP